jgi:uncharacterized membrane protein YeaQ/YmgE (transglycosylase-associated protein family)
MSVIGWLVVGLIEGFIASLLAADDGPGFVVDLVLGAAGAVGGGLVYSSFGPSLAGFDLVSIGVALLGAVVVLVIYHLVAARGAD